MVSAPWSNEAVDPPDAAPLQHARHEPAHTERLIAPILLVAAFILLVGTAMTGQWAGFWIIAGLTAIGGIGWFASVGADSFINSTK